MVSAHHGPRGSQPRATGGALALAATLALLTACGGAEPPRAGAADGEVTHTQKTVRTLDEVLSVEIGDDLIVHAMERSIFATTSDATVRLYLRWDAGTTVVRALGDKKEALAGRGWEITAERHYEAAAELTAQKGRAERKIARQLWLFERGGRVVTCEALATTATIERLQTQLRAQCQRVEVTAMTPAADAGDATAGGGSEADSAAGAPSAGDAGASEADVGPSPGPAP